MSGIPIIYEYMMLHHRDGNKSAPTVGSSMKMEAQSVLEIQEQRHVEEGTSLPGSSRIICALSL